MLRGSGVPRGGAGGHGPRAPALEGAPAQLVGPNCKKKIRPRQISQGPTDQSRFTGHPTLGYFLYFAVILGRRFSGEDTQRLGIVHSICDPDNSSDYRDGPLA